MSKLYLIREEDRELLLGLKRFASRLKGDIGPAIWAEVIAGLERSRSIAADARCLGESAGPLTDVDRVAIASVALEPVDSYGQIAGESVANAELLERREFTHAERCAVVRWIADVCEGVERLADIAAGRCVITAASETKVVRGVVKTREVKAGELEKAKG
jgi:hypothetical protein